MNKVFNWKIFFILWIAAILGVIAIIPYSLALQSGTLQNTVLPISLPALIAIQIAQNALLFGVLTVTGLFFANRIGLGTPILEAGLQGEPVAEKVRAIVLNGLAGIFFGYLYWKRGLESAMVAHFFRGHHLARITCIVGV